MSIKSGWTVSQAAYLRTFSHLFHLITALSTPTKQHKKIALLKKQGVTGAGQRGRTSISFQEEKYSGN